MTGRLTRVPAKGRRATILGAACDDFLTMSEIVLRVRAVEALRHPDQSVERLKTTAAVRDLRRGGYLSKTPHGYRTSAAGLDLLRASEGCHA